MAEEKKDQEATKKHSSVQIDDETADAVAGGFDPRLDDAKAPKRRK